MIISTKNQTRFSVRNSVSEVMNQKANKDIMATNKIHYYLNEHYYQQMFSNRKTALDQALFK